MESTIIRAAGNFLQNYQSDLNYILQFRRFKGNPDDNEKYFLEYSVPFKSFINEFRVAWEFNKIGETIKLLKLSKKWVQRKHCNDVDKFAIYLREHKITNGKTLLSLASKILFLNDPYTILPLDKRVRNAVGTKEKSYSTYQDLALKFKKDNALIIQDTLSYLKPFFTEIEVDFKQLDRIERIRENRFIDKLLWSKGGK